MNKRRSLVYCDASCTVSKMQQQQIRAAEDLKRASMRELFTRRLRGEAQKETEIGPVPASWEIVRLGSLGRIGNGTTPNRTRIEYWRDGTVPWITSGRMYEHNITASEYCLTPAAFRDYSLPLLGPGTVLIAIVGQGGRSDIARYSRLRPRSVDM